MICLVRQFECHINACRSQNQWIKGARAMNNELQYGVIGNGRLAKHLLHWFGAMGLRVRNWSRAVEGRAVPVEVQLEAADVILLAIKDDAIDDFILACRRKP
jgi:phosphoglycerate dehydrogenase-like enzyme